MKTYTWNSSVALLSPTCLLFNQPEAGGGEYIVEANNVNKAHQVFKNRLCKKEGLYPITYRVVIIFCPF